MPLIRIRVAFFRRLFNVLGLKIFFQYTGYMPGKKRIYYYVMCVGAFAGAKNLTQKDAFNYLEKYKGMEFLIDCYDAEHTLSVDDAVDDLTLVCKKNGGTVE
jgi:hypothetical protein